MEKDPHLMILHCLLSPSHEKPPPVKNWKDKLESHLLTLKNSSDGDDIDDVDGWENLLADLPLFASRGILWQYLSFPEPSIAQAEQENWVVLHSLVHMKESLALKV